MMKTTPTQWLTAAAALLVTATVAAQQQPPDFSKVEIKTTRNVTRKPVIAVCLESRDDRAAVLVLNELLRGGTA
jgi:hypothetical protein